MATRRARSARGCAAASCTASRREVGATKIALGHHLDDFVETVLLNLFFQGSLKAMPARLVSDNQQHIVIRPLVYVTEAEARAYTQECGLPVIGCCCPACGDLSLKRQRIKRLIAELELEHPDIKNSMIKALGHVVPSHLLDTPSATLWREMSAGLTSRSREPGLTTSGRAARTRCVRQRIVRASSSACRPHRSPSTDRVVAQIGPGLLVLVGVAEGDGPADIEYTRRRFGTCGSFQTKRAA